MLKSTGVYFEGKDKPPGFPSLALRLYIASVIVLVFVQHFGFRIVSIPVEQARAEIAGYETYEAQTKDQAQAQPKSHQRAIVLSSAYGIRLGGAFVPFGDGPAAGDAVIVKTRPDFVSGMPRAKKFERMWFFARRVIAALSLGIIPSPVSYSVMSVAATAGARVDFSGASVGTSGGVIAPAGLSVAGAGSAYFDARGSMQVPDGSVFLKSATPYAIDSRFRGAYETREIAGKIVLLAGPLWRALP